MAQIFIGRKSLVADAYGMSTYKEFVNTLEDNIQKRGAMDTFISDSARVETLKQVQDIWNLPTKPTLPTILQFERKRATPNREDRGGIYEKNLEHFKRMSHHSIISRVWSISCQI